LRSRLGLTIIAETLTALIKFIIVIFVGFLLYTILNEPAPEPLDEYYCERLSKREVPKTFAGGILLRDREKEQEIYLECIEEVEGLEVQELLLRLNQIIWWY
jgi:hypothetical protein